MSCPRCKLNAKIGDDSFFMEGIEDTVAARYIEWIGEVRERDIRRFWQPPPLVMPSGHAGEGTHSVDATMPNAEQGEEPKAP